MQYALALAIALMQRNLADFYFKEAKRLGFLARPAFKLVQIQVCLTDALRRRLHCTPAGVVVVSTEPSSADGRSQEEGC